MKKFLALGLGCVLTASLFTGCGEKVETSAPAPEVKVVKLGVIKHLNEEESNINSRTKEINERINAQIGQETPLHEIQFYPNFSTMQMALESGKIDEIDVYQPVADYLILKNPNMEIFENHVPISKEFSNNICCAFRAEDTELKATVDNVITEMKNDGTLDNFVKTYIIDLKADEEPPAVAFENFDGAKTIKVAVTGDLPPLDYVSADGKAAGFNTAVLSELGKRLQKNIEVIQIESAARATTLTSKKADIIFWALVPSNEVVGASLLPADADKPEGIELSTPYYNAAVVHIGLKK